MNEDLLPLAFSALAHMQNSQMLQFILQQLHFLLPLKEAANFTIIAFQRQQIISRRFYAR